MSPAIGLPRARATRSMKTWTWLVVVALVGVGSFVAGTLGKSTRASAASVPAPHTFTDEEWEAIPIPVTATFENVDAIARRFSCSRTLAWRSICDLLVAQRTDEYESGALGVSTRFLSCTAQGGSKPVPLDISDATETLGRALLAGQSWDKAGAALRQRYGLTD